LSYAAPVNRPEWQRLAERFASGCAEAGLDLTHPFNVRQYNFQAWENERLFDFERPDALGILVGNTKQLWPVFTRAVREDPALQGEPHPLDSYVTARLRALATATFGHRSQLIFSHATAPKAFPIQRLAEAVDFAGLSPSHLSVHPQHGPWIALRAVVVVDVAGPPLAPAELARPCRGCSAPCVPALKRALSVSTPPVSAASIAEHAREWIAVRDACPVGRSSRYGEEQLTYHYVKAPLRPLVRPAQGS
jgi:cyanocobalamin reductase (cyanide-eliminating) / alkylcobalamin dealkylase